MSAPSSIGSDGCELRRIADLPHAALAIVTRSIAGQQPTPWVDRADLPDPAVAAAAVLARHLKPDDDVSGWMAVTPDGEARAIVCASLEIADENHPGYTYLPERYAQVALSGWHIITAADARLLPRLLAAVRADAQRRGIRRLMVQTRPHDWIGGSAWRQLGLRPDTVMAGRRAIACPTPGTPGLHNAVRRAGAADEDALVALSMEEYAYHAEHTRTGTRADQVDGPTRQIVRGWIDGTDGQGAYVALDGDGRVIGCLAVETIDLPAGSPGRYYYPASYGYIGMTSVTADARRGGVGKVLAARAIDHFAAAGVEHVMLHYVDDNPVSRPFWTAMGFSPHVVTLAGDVL